MADKLVAIVIRTARLRPALLQPRRQLLHPNAPLACLSLSVPLSLSLSLSLCLSVSLSPPAVSTQASPHCRDPTLCASEALGARAPEVPEPPHLRPCVHVCGTQKSLVGADRRRVGCLWRLRCVIFVESLAASPTVQAGIPLQMCDLTLS